MLNHYGLFHDALAIKIIQHLIARVLAFLLQSGEFIVIILASLSKLSLPSIDLVHFSGRLV